MSDVNDGERDQLTVPAGVAGLAGVMYLHGLFPEAFLAEIDAAREDTPVTLASSNMYCDRRFLRDAALASRVLEHLPRELGFKHVLSDLRFLEYPPGGHILTHVDGVRRDDETNVDSTNSFLLFMVSVPPGEGGGDGVPRRGERRRGGVVRGEAGPRERTRVPSRRPASRAVRLEPREGVAPG